MSLDPIVIIVFAVVYLGMIVGRIPPLALDRTGMALLGAIVLVAFRKLGPNDAARAIDVPTMALLFGLMVVSAQFRLGGFYTQVTRRIATANWRPASLLAVLMAVEAVLSAILANDIVCLAVAPVVVEASARKRLNPVPHLIGLACASNIGSAATLIGNPQNMLIGQVLDLGFARYLIDAAVPSILGLAVTWAIIAWQYRGKWEGPGEVPEIEAPVFNAWQSSKGLVVTAFLMGAFLFSPWPREVVALACAGVLLTSRRMATRKMLGQVDWQLLVLFAGLFVVNHALQKSGALDLAVHGLADAGVDVRRPGWLFVSTVVLSNIVSNVPAVMLLLPSASFHPAGGAILALASTLAGNLFLVGSIANLIVVDQAARLGVRIGWREHAKSGIPVTVATLAIAWVWMWVRGG